MDMQDRVNPLNIKIGSPARCRDGRAGRVIKLVVEPGSKRVTHIVVARGVLLHHDVAVPIECVERVQDGWVVLDLSVEELNALPAYAEVDYAVPDAAWAAEHGYPPDGTLVDLRSTAPGGLLAPAWSGLLIQGHTHAGAPAQEIPVGRGTRVTYREGALGRLDHVLLDPETGVVRALVVRKGHLLAKDVVDADRALLERLPEYRTHRSVTAGVPPQRFVRHGTRHATWLC
jgi:sporulation protein YlmC with PRC-barrel domain